MYILNALEINSFDINKSQSFIDLWCRFNTYKVKIYQQDTYINYLAELNLGHDLTTDNVKRLLRWKDQHKLTEVILSGSNKNEQNKRVLRVLNAISDINQFRRGEITEEIMKEKVSKIFKDGIVYQVFIFHIAKPNLYPIVDQHVLSDVC